MKKNILLSSSVLLLLLGIAIFGITTTNNGKASVYEVSENEEQNGFTSLPTNPNSIEPQRFIYEARPGDSIIDSLTVENLAKKNQVFNLYGVDSVLNEKNELQPLLRTNEQKEMGKWISFSTPEITLSDKGKSDNQFTIIIPKDTPHGDYSGFIGTEKFAFDEKNKQIKIVTRKVHLVEIKVTDTPQKVPSYKEEWDKSYANALKAKATSYTTGAIFITCFGYLAYDYIRKRRKSTTAKAPKK